MRTVMIACAFLSLAGCEAEDPEPAALASATNPKLAACVAREAEAFIKVYDCVQSTGLADDCGARELQRRYGTAPGDVGPDAAAKFCASQLGDPVD